jgi:hypothetical protein
MGAELQFLLGVAELALPPRRVPELLFVPDAFPGRRVSVEDYHLWVCIINTDA